MARNRRRFGFSFLSEHLERRELLAHVAGIDLPPPIVAGSVPPVTKNYFHQNGLDGLLMHRQFERQMNYRLRLSGQMTNRLFQAFQVFLQNYAGVPVLTAPTSGNTSTNTTSPTTPTPTATAQPTVNTAGPLGAPPASFTLPSLLATLQQQVDSALSTRVLTTFDQSPSDVNGRKNSPLTPVSLVVFANEQIAQLGRTIAALPPVRGANGQLTNADISKPLDTAYNAILNAVAETTLHPLLFLQPTSFYINPNAHFALSYDSSNEPATEANGFFTRGPGGQFLPGAILRPHQPN